MNKQFWMIMMFLSSGIYASAPSGAPVDAANSETTQSPTRQTGAQSRLGDRRWSEVYTSQTRADFARLLEARAVERTDCASKVTEAAKSGPVVLPAVPEQPE